ncbi:MAG: hypothetical protein FWC82_00475 [Firmicutes bacterium]|nr:hypothetical protein [Bacillota bacterium]
MDLISVSTTETERVLTFRYYTLVGAGIDRPLDTECSLLGACGRSMPAPTRISYLSKSRKTNPYEPTLTTKNRLAVY